MKKALNFLIAAIIMTIVSIGLTFGMGFVENAQTALVLVRAVAVLSISTSVVSMIACYFGKAAKNKNFSIAFWINIGMILLNVIVFVFSEINIDILGLIVTFNLLNTICSVLTFLFIILGCREAVPSVGKLAITCAVFMALGLFVVGALQYIPKLSEDFKAPILSVGSIVFLVGCILFVVLIFKSRARVNK